MRCTGAKIHYDKGEQPLALRRGGGRQGSQLKGLVHAVPDGLGMLHILQKQAILLHTRDAKGVVDGAHLQPRSGVDSCMGCRYLAEEG